MMDSFPDEHLTPVEAVVSTVETLIKGGNIKDSNGKEVTKNENFGLAVEIFGRSIFFRDQVEYSNNGLRELCDAASLKNQKANLYSKI
jgi:hypothetical protein